MTLYRMLAMVAVLVMVIGCGQSSQATKPSETKPQAATPKSEPAAAKSGAVQNVTDADFEAVVLKSDRPVLVDFWAEWCGPCRTQGPIVEKVAAEFGDKVKIVKLNVDNAKTTAKAYGITAIPTLIIFKDGKSVFNRVGLTEEAQLKAELAKLF